jgi:hypothetical protein
MNPLDIFIHGVSEARVQTAVYKNLAFSVCFHLIAALDAEYVRNASRNCCRCLEQIIAAGGDYIRVCIIEPKPNTKLIDTAQAIHTKAYI